MAKQLTRKGVRILGRLLVRLTIALRNYVVEAAVWSLPSPYSIYADGAPSAIIQVFNWIRQDENCRHIDITVLGGFLRFYRMHVDKQCIDIAVRNLSALKHIFKRLRQPGSPLSLEDDYWIFQDKFYLNFISVHDYLPILDTNHGSKNRTGADSSKVDCSKAGPSNIDSSKASFLKATSSKINENSLDMVPARFPIAPTGAIILQAYYGLRDRYEVPRHWMRELFGEVSRRYPSRRGTRIICQAPGDSVYVTKNIMAGGVCLSALSLVYLFSSFLWAPLCLLAQFLASFSWLFRR
ncbi:uncharacterized protein BO97DRAFT_413130 [Aspergillus homomorphus CBS 101889]|uniref:Uncharacterized protein n=1 Tax=Aspergillus homomorphus (strain CBS 101889) TaxID=1450537 RepID=A0A395I418_ASPHC|nr:hypothetical protein BO97DRAFT_413130 [Aspergillus homomorphus CBS 101889]RAL13928.1 hypothetical protein BO97DRAFT_413130 [Aspergillus homomorphus CBS 101889]